MKQVTALCLSLLSAVAFDAAVVKADTPTEDVEIRVRNVSDSQFDKIRITHGDHVELYGVLEPGEVSSYHRIKGASSNANAIVLSAGKLFLIPATIDGADATLLEPGKYTYELKVRPAKSAIAVGGIVYHGYVEIVRKREADDT